MSWLGVLAGGPEAGFTCALVLGSIERHHKGGERVHGTCRVIQQARPGIAQGGVVALFGRSEAMRGDRVGSGEKRIAPANSQPVCHGGDVSEEQPAGGLTGTQVMVLARDLTLDRDTDNCR